MSKKFTPLLDRGVRLRSLQAQQAKAPAVTGNDHEAHSGTRVLQELAADLLTIAERSPHYIAEHPDEIARLHSQMAINLEALVDWLRSATMNPEAFIAELEALRRASEPAHAGAHCPH